MLQLRKILLLDRLYIIILIVAVLTLIIRICNEKESIYTENNYKEVGKIVSIEKIDNNYNIIIKNKEKLLIKYNDNNNNIRLNLGDTIEIEGIFYKPQKNTTKYLFNYKKYLQRKQINFIVNAKKIRIIKSNNNIYYYLKQKITNYIGNNPYLNTFILGNKSLIKKDVMKSYQENGISHLFAISGMHITLLATIITRLLRKKISEENTFKITSLFLIIYLLLVGLYPSILRGVLFFIIFGINKIYYFYIKPTNIFILILSISIFINPYYIYDVGFEYSYVISFSLLCFSDRLKSNNYFISLLKVSIISFISSLPITLYNYYQINIFGIIYNLFFVPFISLIVFPISIICFFIKPLEPIQILLTSLLEIVSLNLYKINILKLQFVRLPFYIYIIYLLLIVIFLIYKQKKIIIILFIMLFIHFFIPYLDDTYIFNIDIGQGDSSLIKINNRVLLIDTGGNKNKDLSNSILIPFFKSRAISKADYLIITHGDYDHMGEAINLVNNFKVEKVIFNCGEFNDLEQELIRVLDKKKIPYYSCIKELNIDKNKLYFLQTKEYDNENDNSNVIYTELNGYKFMFMGDASINTEKEIMNKYNLQDIDVLKVGHHGSKTSSGKEFINEINPKYSIISVGKNNRYGHPNKEVLNNLDDSKIYRTDRDGSIMFKIKNDKLRVETCSP